MRAGGFLSGAGGVRSRVTGAPGEVGADTGCAEFERLDKAAVVGPVAVRLARALGVPAPQEASAKTVPASSPNRRIADLSAGIASSKAHTSSTI